MTKKVRLFLTMLFLTLLGGVNAAWAADTWVKTAPSSLQTGDIVVIVDETSKKAMSNGNGTNSAPTATAVTLEGNKITSTVGENIQWEVSVSNVNSTDYYQFKVYGTDNYLYCTNTNNGVRVGTNTNNVFSIYNNNGVDFLYNEETSRYLGVYNSQDWRCYSSINTNINSTVTAFYKKVSTSGPVDPSVTISAETVEVGKTITISGPSGLVIEFESDDESVATVNDEGVVTGVAEGEATITASWAATTDYNSGSQEFTVTVTAAVASTVYEKVTNANQLVAGNKYILVAEGSSMAMGKNNGKNRSNVSVTISNDEVEITNEEVTILTLGGNSGAWTLLASDDSKYLALTANSNELHASDDASLNTSKWVITDDFQLETNAQSDARYLRYNSGSPRFACYKSGQVQAYLYVKSGSSTNTKAEPGFSFGASTAEASLGGDFTAPEFSNPNNVTVSFTSSVPTVATIDESGNVTIVAAGTTTISATSEETDTYLAGTASYTLTVTDPNAPGTENNPYTVDQARAAIDAGTGVTGVYATGIVSEIVTAYNSQYGNITYNISADGSTTADQLQAYRGKSYNGDNFTSEDDIQVGDVVVIYGNLKKYNTTYEFDANNQLVSLERQAQAKYYVAGDWTNWSDGMVEMTKASASEYSLDGQTVSNGQQFKIVKVDADGTTTTWFGGDTQGQGDTYGIHSGWCTDIALTDGSAGSNFIIQSSKESTYTFTLNVENMTLSVTGWPQPTYYLAGSFATTDAWADDMVEFESQGNLIYTLTKELEANTELKIVNETQDQWYSTNPAELTKENSSQGIQLSTDNGQNMLIAPAGTYTFTLDANTMKLTVTGWPIVIEGNAFVKVTSTDELTDGAYLIVCEDAVGGNMAFDGDLETLDVSANTEDVKCIDNRLVVADENNLNSYFTISNGAIQSASGSYIGVYAYSNGLKTSDSSSEFSNDISFDANGNVIIKIQFDDGPMILSYNGNSGQERFRYYKGGMGAIQLYKLQKVSAPIYNYFGETHYGTLYYGKEAVVIPDGVSAYTVSVENNEMTMTKLEDFIPKGTGVVLHQDDEVAPEDGYAFLVIPGSTTLPPADNMLLGFDDTGKMTVGPNGETEGYKFYMLSLDKNGENVGFYYGAPKGAAFQTKKSRAYLAVPNAAAGAKVAFPFSEADITDGIGAVERTRFNAQGAEIYNLNGQRVSTPQRGIYIINGKKVLVK